MLCFCPDLPIHLQIISHYVNCARCREDVPSSFQALTPHLTVLIGFPRLIRVQTAGASAGAMVLRFRVTYSAYTALTLEFAELLQYSAAPAFAAVTVAGDTAHGDIHGAKLSGI